MSTLAVQPRDETRASTFLYDEEDQGPSFWTTVRREEGEGTGEGRPVRLVYHHLGRLTGEDKDERVYPYPTPLLLLREKSEGGFTIRRGQVDRIGETLYSLSSQRKRGNTVSIYAERTPLSLINRPRLLLRLPTSSYDPSEIGYLVGPNPNGSLSDRLLTPIFSVGESIPSEGQRRKRRGIVFPSDGGKETVFFPEEGRMDLFLPVWEQPRDLFLSPHTQV